MSYVFGHDITNIRHDLEKIQEALQEVSEILQDFEQQSFETSQELNTFDDIFGRIDDAVESCKNMDNKMEEIEKSYASQGQEPPTGSL
jgi:chromosome segregation ATPase